MAAHPEAQLLLLARLYTQMPLFRWVDKEIRKVIELIKKHGTLCEGKRTILFGDLFKVGVLCGTGLDLAWTRSRTI